MRQEPFFILKQRGCLLFGSLSLWHTSRIFMVLGTFAFFIRKLLYQTLKDQDIFRLTIVFFYLKHHIYHLNRVCEFFASKGMFFF